MNAVSREVRTCPLCNQLSSYDDLTGFYYCDHCDQIVQLIPDNYSLVLSGPPGAGKTPTFNYWAHFYCRNNRPVVFLTFDDFPANLRNSFNSYYNGKLAAFEGSGFITYVDCYASIAGVQSQEKIALKNIADLNELRFLVTDLLEGKSKMGSTKIIMDSVTPLFTYADAELVVPFLGGLAAKAKAKNGALAFSITSGTTNDETVKRLETLMDFALEIRVDEVDGRKKRQMRIAKARGQRIYEEWMPIYIGTKAISIDVGEDPVKYERLKKTLMSGS